jgi:hypothetical protein
VTLFLTALPLAFVMIAGPQIISAFFFATAPQWRSISAAYIAGAAISLASLVTIAYFVAKGIKSSASSSSKGDVKRYIDYAVIALLAFAGVYTFLKKRHADPPKWMGKLEGATPKFAFTLGFLLLGVFPSDLATSVSVGSHLAGHDKPWWYTMGFVALTLLFLAIPVLLLLTLGRRAETILPKARNWMNTNSWIISEIVIVVFLVLLISDL